VTADRPAVFRNEEFVGLGLRVLAKGSERFCLPIISWKEKYCVEYFSFGLV